MNINLFGTFTLTGEYLRKQFKSQFPNAHISIYSRKLTGNEYLDFLSPDQFNPNHSDQNSLWISFGPIWLFSTFFESLINFHPEKLNNLTGLIICSSSSIITKRFSSNQFDKELVKSLRIAEEKIILLCKRVNIPYFIIRPTLIYGKSENFEDNNISKIEKIMRVSPFILLPSKTGLRQPIHSSQLSQICLTLVKRICSKLDIEYEKDRIITCGGDSILSYKEMIIAIKNSSKTNDPIRRCQIFSIPNGLFLFLCSPIQLFSPKTFESIQRICSNLSGFTPSSEITNTPKIEFPVISYSKSSSDINIS
tara:strand:+ start:2067 stop:2990 length:924 start_codon:yes stop_codon:yes gene_type:complete